MIRKFNSNLASIVMSECPELAWRPWDFKHAHFGPWLETLNGLFSKGDIISAAVVWDLLSEVERGTNLDGWYSVELTDQQSQIIKSLGGLASILNKFYPHYPWESARFAVLREKRKTALPEEHQKEIVSEVGELLGDTEIRTRTCSCSLLLVSLWLTMTIGVSPTI